MWFDKAVLFNITQAFLSLQIFTKLSANCSIRVSLSGYLACKINCIEKLAKKRQTVVLRSFFLSHSTSIFVVLIKDEKLL